VECGEKDGLRVNRFMTNLIGNKTYFPNEQLNQARRCFRSQVKLYKKQNTHFPRTQKRLEQEKRHRTQTAPGGPKNPQN